MLDELNFPPPIPFFQSFFTSDCVFDIRKLLVIDQSVDLIFVGETGHRVSSMLVNTADKVIGDADVKGAADPTGEDVNPESSLPTHHRLPGVLDCPLARAMTPRGLIAPMPSFATIAACCCVSFIVISSRCAHARES